MSVVFPLYLRQIKKIQRVEKPIKKSVVVLVDKPNIHTIIKEVVAPVIEEVVAPVIEEVAAPVIEEVAAPVIKEVAAPVIEEVAAPVIEETHNIKAKFSKRNKIAHYSSTTSNKIHI
jgi:hypothetical protein